MTRAQARDFVAVDVETASADLASICQIGIARFHKGYLVDVETHLVRPRGRFAASHAAIHGINAARVVKAPAWDEVYAHVRPGMLGKTIVSHTIFDRKAIFQACCRGKSPMFSYVRWIDSCQVARRAWPGLEGYSLGALARNAGLPHRAHDAGEDARVAGQVYLLASQEISRRNQASISSDHEAASGVEFMVERIL